jgi:AcrR family transcriptional regulator
MKRARSGPGKNANPQSRLAPTAFELARTALLNRDAIDAAGDQFARSKMRLDEHEAVGLSGNMGKAASKGQSATGKFAGGDEESARGRLLSAATRLFCKNGINATGIDAIINEAGTAKTTLYKLFGSKNNLVHVVLETEGKQWREWFVAAIEAGGGSAQIKLTRIFPALKDWFRQERFYGCPFINAVGEHDKDQKQLRAIAMRHKKVVLAYIEKLAGEMGASEPEVLAHQLGLLMDGAIVAAMVSRDPGVADTAGLVACSLFVPSKPKKPKRAGTSQDQLIAV